VGTENSQDACEHMCTRTHIQAHACACTHTHKIGNNLL